MAQAASAGRAFELRHEVCAAIGIRCMTTYGPVGDEETRPSSSRARRVIAGSLRIGEYLLTRESVARRGGTRRQLHSFSLSQWCRSNANAGGGTFILVCRTARCRRLQEYTRVTFEYKRWLLATLLVKGGAQLL